MAASASPTKRSLKAGVLLLQVLLLLHQSHAWISTSTSTSTAPQLRNKRDSRLVATSTIPRAAVSSSSSFLSQPPAQSVNVNSSSPSSQLQPHSWTSLPDDHVLDTVLRDLQVQPPWNGKPIYSTRTFNWILSQLAGEDDSGTASTASTASTGVTASTGNAGTVTGTGTTVTAKRASAVGQLSLQILRYLITQSVTRSELQPDTITLNCALKSLSVQGDPGAAHAVLREWQQLYKKKAVQHAADRISFNTVVAAYAKKGMAKQAQQVLDELEQLFQEANNPDLQPDAVTYSTVMRAHGMTGQADKARDLLQQMLLNNNNNMNNTAPTTECYNEVLYATAKSRQPEDAVHFLRKWIADVANQKNGTSASASSVGLVDPPDSRSYNIVLHALAQSRDAESAVRQALDLFASMPVRDSVSYTTVIAICCRRRSPMSFSDAALDQVDAILRLAWKDPAAEVNSAFISNVLYSVATCDDKQDTAGFAEDLVKEFLAAAKVEPDLGVYNALLYCWAKSGSRRAFRRVSAILSALEEHAFLRPNVKTYTTVLDALAKSRNSEAVTAAEEIMTRMETNGPSPNVQAYTALIQNYSRSKLPFKAVKAAETLKRMKQAASLDARPNIVAYNAVLNACEHTDRSDEFCVEEALTVAFLTFDEIRNSASVVPNHVTYGSFLGVVANLMPTASRQEIVSLVFRRCVSTGQVSRLVLKKLRNAVDTEAAYLALLQGNAENRLPKTWTSGVRESRARDL
jgi:pentatricopeptide repeat protein